MAPRRRLTDDAGSRDPLTGPRPPEAGRQKFHGQRRAVTSNIKWLAGANLAVKPLWFLFLLGSTRYLGAEEFGKYMFAISFIAVIAVFLEGGIDVHLVRELSANADRFPRFFAHSLFLKVSSGVLTFLVALVLMWATPVPAGMTLLLVISTIVSLMNTLMIHGRAVFRAFEVMHYEAISIVVEKVSIVLLCAGALAVANNATSFLTGFAIAYSIACLVTFSLVFTKIGVPAAGLDWSYLWKRVVKTALPFALMNLFTVIYYRSGTLLLGALIGKEEVVGFYNAGYRLVESYMLFPAIISGPLYPVFVRRSGTMADLGNILHQGARAVLLVSTLVAVPIFLFSDGFTNLFFGKGFAPAATAVGIVALSMIPVGMNFIFGTLVAASGRQRTGNWFILVVTLLNIGLNCFLIPKYQAAGAAVATLATEGMLAVSYVWIVRDAIRWPDFLRLLLKISVPVSLVLVSRLLGVSFGGFFINVMVAMSILLFSFMALRVVPLADLKKLVRVQ